MIGCPNKYCQDLIPSIELIDLFHNNLPPIAGGVLDQSASFLTAAKLLKHEDQLAQS